MNGLIVDLFAGGGGASTGIEAALGRPVDLAINHSATALAVHATNHPETRHLTADIWEVDPRIAVGRRKVDLLWASPDCRHFSRAKSGVPRSKSVRSLAEVVVEWARAVRPAVILLENVLEFVTWGPLDDATGLPIKERAGETFALWVGKLRLLGYQVEWRALTASHYGAPTKRRRLFLVARCDGERICWPDETHGPGLSPFRTAAECIDWSIPCPSIFGRKKMHAEKTLARIAEGTRRFVLDAPQPFLVRYNGQGNALPIDEPLGTLTTKDRFGLVAPTLIQTGYGERPGQAPRALDLHEPMGTLVAGGVKQALVCASFVVRHFGGVYGQSLRDPLSTITAQDHHSLATLELGSDRSDEVDALLRRFGIPGPYSVRVGGEELPIGDLGMRMLEPHELLRAQFGRFAADYDLSAATTKSAKVRLVGNSVCPEVAEAIVRANVPQAQQARVA